MRPREAFRNMDNKTIPPWQHDHVFGQDKKNAGESRTLLVVMLTAVMMVVELIAGIAYGSMALLADGLHMASHTAALGIALFAYIYSRKRSSSALFSFGTGKVNSLAGFGSAVLLAGFALVMISESTDRLINPVNIIFDQALIVAVIGLIVNAVSAWLLIGTPHDHDHDHSHEHHHDHNLRAAYLHVIADALTSILAIGALLAGKFFGANWLDPMMGLVGAALIARWSYGLLKDSGRVLLDHQATQDVTDKVREAILASTAEQIVDLHVWSIGHRIFAANITIVSDNPQSPEYYRSRLLDKLGIVHLTVEVHQRSPIAIVSSKVKEE
jgi:cation diffusion facilitator family transporter